MRRASSQQKSSAPKVLSFFKRSPPTEEQPFRQKHSKSPHRITHRGCSPKPSGAITIYVLQTAVINKAGKRLTQ